MPEKKGWLSGNMAQLTVLLTGLVLAGTAYAILNILIQQMVTDHLERAVLETQHVITQDIGNLEKSVEALASIVSLSKDVAADKLRDSVVSSLPETDGFDRILWLRPSDNGEWTAANILSGDTSDFSQAVLKSIAHAVLAKTPDNGDDAVVLSNPPGTQDWQEYADPVVKGRYFIIARVLGTENNGRGIIVGMSHVGRILKRDWLNNHMSILRLVVRDIETGRRVYFMNRDLAAGEEVDFKTSGENKAFRVGGSQWQLNVLAGPDQQTKFLAQTPWLMLAFGITLTLIGTFYVRNNQRQSFRLASMNRQLAQKNYELNSEVSERERLNQIVRKAEREYRAIIDAVSDIIFETTIGGEIVFLNNTWLKVTGFEPEQIIGRNLFDLLYPQDQEEQRSNFDMLVKGRKGAYRAFTKLRTSDGTFRSVELAVSMLRQDENKNMRVVGTFTDVEERRRAEKALSEAEKKYRTIVENAAGGIYQVTPEGQFLSANPAMARILGYETPEQMLREVRNAHDHLYVSLRDRAFFIRELETRGVVHNFETEVRTRDGGKIWVNENARAVKDDEGNILYYEGSMEDVTSRKEAEVNLKDAMVQSDLANRAKSEFLANMSHELRTPLNAIIGFAEIIKDEVLGPMANRQYWDYAKDIHESGQKLLTIINEILDVSRIEAGERQINESLVNMNEITRSCVGFMGQKAEEAHLKISDMTQGKLPNVIGEELAIKQVLINLMGNAIKYTPEGGRITISYEVENNGRLRISITDTGIGMEEHEIEKAISPFGQLESSLDRSGSGAGLGLTLAQALMKLHEGELEIFSQKGIGTTATIVFPAKRVILDETYRGAESQDGDTSNPRIH